MSALITRVEHALAAAASDTVKVVKFVETSVLPVLKKAQADQSTIESATSLVRPSRRPTSNERDSRSSAWSSTPSMPLAPGANGLNIALDANLVTDIRSIASAVKGAVPVTAKLIHAARSVRLISPFKHVRLVTYAAKR
jgi:hypothetical protein